MEQLERICRECFWDYTITPDEIKKIISEGTYQQKKKLFDKIILNSTDRLRDLRLFSNEDLCKFFSENAVVSKSKYMERRIDILRYLLLHEKRYVKGLEWEKA